MINCSYISKLIKATIELKSDPQAFFRTQLFCNILYGCAPASFKRHLMKFLDLNPHQNRFNISSSTQVNKIILVWHRGREQTGW